MRGLHDLWRGSKYSKALPLIYIFPRPSAERILAPLPFLHTHRKETRFPSNRAGYISVFLGIGVGDVDTGFS